MSDQRKQVALDDLATLVGQRDELEQEILRAVAHALNTGATWSQVEKAAKLQRGTGQRHYGRHLVEERRYRVRETGDETP
ncbi:hypothetical protein GCM10022251_47910 [Phytohabitans flavus]|uniref:Uncharacterized protein n=1 Tax=Phytohabitans flavus TaxID=1076124 RepID=A0A6F8Y8I5_9ACTN|nr:hypothetical protein [Phytohabitans flavus]BCB82370.1 hypothetical protein Pflav_087800 [Phytohabitans flavus]